MLVEIQALVAPSTPTARRAAPWSAGTAAGSPWCWPCWRRAAALDRRARHLSQCRRRLAHRRAGGRSRRRGGADLRADAEPVPAGHRGLRRDRPVGRCAPGAAGRARLKEAAKLGFTARRGAGAARRRKAPRHRRCSSRSASVDAIWASWSGASSADAAPAAATGGWHGRLEPVVDLGRHRRRRSCLRPIRLRARLRARGAVDRRLGRRGLRRALSPALCCALSRGAASPSGLVADASPASRIVPGRCIVLPLVSHMLRAARQAQLGFRPLDRTARAALRLGARRASLGIAYLVFTGARVDLQRSRTGWRGAHLAAVRSRSRRASCWHCVPRARNRCRALPKRCAAGQRMRPRRRCASPDRRADCGATRAGQRISPGPSPTPKPRCDSRSMAESGYGAQASRTRARQTSRRATGSNGAAADDRPSSKREPPSTTTSCTRNAACSAFSAMPKRRRWRARACTRCSIAARKRPASSPIDGEQFHAHRGMGHVGDNFSSKERDRPSSRAIPPSAMCAMPRPARRRCATSSRCSPISSSAASPSATTATSPMPIPAPRAGAARHASSNRPRDTEVIVHLDRDAACKRSVEERLIDALRQVEGAYSLVALTPRKADRRARSAGRAAAGAGQARRRLDPRVGDLRARHHRRRFRARRRAGRDGRHRATGRHRSATPFEHAAAALLHLRIHLFRAARQRGRRPQRLRGAQAHRRRAGAREPRSPPTSSSRCRIPACRRRSAMPRRPGCPSSSASSATIMSAAPSSSRPTTSAIWASS